MFSGLVPKICLKEGEVWRKVVSNKLLSRLSHKVCRLLSSPIPLRKLPIKKANLFRIQIEGQRNWGSGEPTSVLR